MSYRLTIILILVLNNAHIRAWNGRFFFLTYSTSLRMDCCQQDLQHWVHFHFLRFPRSRSPASFQEELLLLCSNDQEWCLIDNELHFPGTSGLALVSLAVLISLILLAGPLWVAYRARAGECWPCVLTSLSNDGTCGRTYVQVAGELSFPRRALK